MNQQQKQDLRIRKLRIAFRKMIALAKIKSQELKENKKKTN
jgi:hypothetical protein